MSVSYSTVVRADRLRQLNASLGPNARLRIYAGPRPDDTDTPISSQQFLAEIIAGPVFGAVNGASLTAYAFLGATVVPGISQAIPSFYRIFKADGVTAMIDGDVGQDLLLSTPYLSTGDSINLTNFVINTAAAASIPSVSAYADGYAEAYA